MIDKKIKKEDLLKEKQYLILLIEKEMGEVIFPLMIDNLNKMSINELTNLLEHLYEENQEEEFEEIVEECDHVDQIIELKDQIKELKKQIKELSKELKKALNKKPVIIKEPVEVEKIVEKVVEKEVPVEKFIEITKEVPIVVEKVVEKIVEVEVPHECKCDKERKCDIGKKHQRFLEKSDFFLKNEDKANSAVHVIKMLEEAGYEHGDAGKLALAIIMSTIEDK